MNEKLREILSKAEEAYEELHRLEDEASEAIDGGKYADEDECDMLKRVRRACSRMRAIVEEEGLCS